MPPKRKKKTKRKKRLYVGQFGPVQPKGPDTSMSTLAAVLSLLAAKPPIPAPPSGGPQHFVMPPTHRTMERAVARSTTGSIEDSMHGMKSSFGSERSDTPIKMQTPSPARQEDDFERPSTPAAREDIEQRVYPAPKEKTRAEMEDYLAHLRSKVPAELKMKNFRNPTQAQNQLVRQRRIMEERERLFQEIADVEQEIEQRFGLVPGSSTDQTMQYSLGGADKTLDYSHGEAERTMHQSLGSFDKTMTQSIDTSGIDPSLVRRFEVMGAAIEHAGFQPQQMPMSPIPTTPGGGFVFSPLAAAGGEFDPNESINEME